MCSLFVSSLEQHLEYPFTASLKSSPPAVVPLTVPPHPTSCLDVFQKRAAKCVELGEGWTRYPCEIATPALTWSVNLEGAFMCTSFKFGDSGVSDSALLYFNAKEAGAVPKDRQDSLTGQQAPANTGHTEHLTTHDARWMRRSVILFSRVRGSVVFCLFICLFLVNNPADNKKNTD